FFKAAMDPDKVPVIGVDGAEQARQKYEFIFGAGSWNQLQSTSTLMAAKDMAATVDRYWELSGDSVGHPESPQVEQLPNETRLNVLVELLSNVAASVFEKIK